MLTPFVNTTYSDAGPCSVLQWHLAGAPIKSQCIFTISRSPDLLFSGDDAMCANWHESRFVRVHECYMK